MKPSLELEILIECIKVIILKNPEKRLKELLDQPVDWKRFEKLLNYHQIRPIVFEAFFKIDYYKVDLSLQGFLQGFVQKQSFFHLFLQNEYNQIANLLTRNEIEFIPYKGIFWKKGFSREGNDIDILIQEKDIERLCRILLSEGFYGKYATPITDYDSLIKEIEFSKERGDIEVTFIKQFSDNRYFELDVHWKVALAYEPINLQTTDIFALTKEEKYFWILLLHNGRKEAWATLKYVSDYLVMIRYLEKNIDWKLYYENAKRFKLFNLLNATNQAFNSQFGISIPTSNNQPNMVNILLKLWETPDVINNNTFAKRLSIEKLKIKVADKPRHTFRYLKDIIRLQSYGNENLKDRLIIFPQKFYILNFLSKLITVLLRKPF